MKRLIELCLENKNAFSIVAWLWLTPLLGESITIETPQSGWRNSSGEAVQFTQSVNYPASSVNLRSEQSKFAMIKGKVSGANKTNDPYKLIVNGNAMPLRVDGETFSRPYIFGGGSNGVEIRSPDNSVRSRVQFYETNSLATQSKLSVLLSWDSDNTDVDLHVISPDGRHVWYGERVSENGGALDIDVTTGYGPEIFSTPSPLKGTYLVYLNYYGGLSKTNLTVCNVTVVFNQNSIDERRETFVVPLRSPGALVLAKSFVVK